MHKQTKICTLVLALLLTLVDIATSQVTQSPYSIFGLGIVEGDNIGVNKAMGGTGIALMSRYSINMHNPASYGGLDSLLSIFELGVFGKYTSYISSSGDQALFNASIKYIVMGFRIAPKIGLSFGLTPYSSVGYKIKSLSPLGGTTYEYVKTYSGEGGVNKIYLGSSFKITRNLFVGINAAYLFGNVTHSESSDGFSYSLKDMTYLSNLNINYGLNYQLKFNKWKYNIGLIYDNGKKLKTKSETTITTASVEETLSVKSKKFSIPQTFGIGLAIEKEYFRAGIDYEMKKWKDIDFNERFLDTRNSNRYSVGIEIPSFGIRKGTSKMIFYRFGAEYNQSYLIIKDTPIDYRAISFGAGIPLKGNVSVINLSVELGQNGTGKHGLIRENSCTLHLDIAMKDFWFIKRKYN